jgi:DNA polymerase III epsilon subunit-like protein
LKRKYLREKRGRKMACLISLDFETGGLLPKYDINTLEHGSPIMSYGYIPIDKNLDIIVDVYEELPPYNLIQPYETNNILSPLVYKKEALDVNGLSIDECKSKGITIEDFCLKFTNMLNALEDDVYIVGSNPEFDVGFLKEAYRISHLEYPKCIRRRTIDVYEMNVLHLYNLHNCIEHALSNASLAKFARHKGAHNAFEDALAVYETLLFHLDGNKWASLKSLKETIYMYKEGKHERD